MLTVTKKGSVSQETLDGDNSYKEINNVAFLDKQEAITWAENHLGHGEYDIIELCPSCSEDSFVDDSSPKYPTKKKIVKRVKMIKIL